MQFALRCSTPSRIDSRLEPRLNVGGTRAAIERGIYSVSILHESIGDYSDAFMHYADLFDKIYRDLYPKAVRPLMSAVELTPREELTALQQCLARWFSMSNT